MTRIKIKEVVWDKWNLEHIKKHKVTSEEVEIAARNIVAHKRAKTGRYAIFSRVGERILTIIIKREKRSVYYIVTARNAAKKERRIVYEKESKK